MIYFAYGSNLNWEQIKQRCPDCFPLTKATLKGWRLQFRRTLDIEPDAPSKVEGVLFYISEQDLKNLDYYEGFPDIYKRVPVMLIDRSNNQLTKALVYTMTKKAKKARGSNPPLKEYLDRVLQGYKDFNMPYKQLREGL